MSMTMTTAPVQKKRRWPWIVGAILLLVIFANMGDDESGGTVHDAAATHDSIIESAPAAPAPTAIVAQPKPSVVAPAPAPVPAPEPVSSEPDMTVSQENAVESAESYLNSMSFSREGLIDQLEYEGYSTADATFAVDNITVDWMEQAAKSAESYMDSMSFSRSGLIGQLEYEGFTAAQAKHGANSVGL